MNKAVKNRSGQPDNPFQRLGRHSMTQPSNSSSLFACEDGDSDEETWGQERSMSRVGSSRAHSRSTSMLRKYSRTMGSARAHVSSLSE